jgi:hypothetical protein
LNRCATVEGVGPSDTERNLERLLAAAAKDPAQRPEFSKTLLESDIYVLGMVEGNLVNGLAQTGTSIRILSIADDDGQLTPFFTSEGALQEYLATRPGTDPRFVRLKCSALFEMTRGSRLVLNPLAAHGKMFLPDEMAALVAGQEPGVTTEVLEAARQVLVGAAAHVPAELSAILARFLTQQPVAEAAYLGWIAHPDGHAGYLMVVVSADRAQAMTGFGSVSIGEVTEGQTLDVMVVAPGEHNMLSGIVPPFYTRQPQVDAPQERKRRWGRRG